MLFTSKIRGVFFQAVAFLLSLVTSNYWCFGEETWFKIDCRSQLVLEALFSVKHQLCRCSILFMFSVCMRIFPLSSHCIFKFYFFICFITEKIVSFDWLRAGLFTVALQCRLTRALSGFSQSYLYDMTCDIWKFFKIELT